MKSIPTFTQELGERTLDVSIGFCNVPDMAREKSIKDGFEINVLIMGRRGLGTTTLVNSLFGAPIVQHSRSNGLTVTKNEIIENGISLETTAITYHSDNILKILEHIDALNMAYFEKEQGPYQVHKDDRVHVCLYLIPSDHLTFSEIEAMQKISQKCNFIPIIAKADMYTPEELKARKEETMLLIRENNIECFVPAPIEHDEEHVKEVKGIIENMPFGVIASETVYEHEGEIIRGRKYPWGFINIENEEGNDFKRLQKLIIYSHLDELINKTDTIYYNSYRKKLLEMERNSESIQMARYNKLKTEMEKIMRERYNRRIEQLKKEESELDQLYQAKENLNMRDLNINGHKNQ
ncbi:Cell division control protein 10 [Nosema granulosis]|uniref:Cell division control protein 10 n=1 Tax=Nosema granulosis TaxID=83296 RepID=A0A9P6GY97_9MICR|nr:Cell division control protein 10 [Nosema granulosis]